MDHLNDGFSIQMPAGAFDIALREAMASIQGAFTRAWPISAGLTRGSLRFYLKKARRRMPNELVIRAVASALSGKCFEVSLHRGEVARYRHNLAEAERAWNARQKEAQGLISSLYDLGANPAELTIARRQVEAEQEWDSAPLLRSLTEPGWREAENRRAEDEARFKAAMEGAELKTVADLRAVLAKLEPESMPPMAPAVAAPKPKRKYVRRVPPSAKRKAKRGRW